MWFVKFYSINLVLDLQFLWVSSIEQPLKKRKLHFVFMNIDVKAQIWNVFIYLFKHTLFKQRHSLTAVRSYNNKSKHKMKYKILYKVQLIPQYEAWTSSSLVNYSRYLPVFSQQANIPFLFSPLLCIGLTYWRDNLSSRLIVGRGPSAKCTVSSKF